MDNVFGDIVNTVVVSIIMLCVIEMDESSVYVLNMIGTGGNYSREMIMKWIGEIVSKKCNAGNESSNKISRYELSNKKKKK